MDEKALKLKMLDELLSSLDENVVGKLKSRKKPTVEVVKVEKEVMPLDEMGEMSEEISENEMPIEAEMRMKECGHSPFDEEDEEEYNPFDSEDSDKEMLLKRLFD